MIRLHVRSVLIAGALAGLAVLPLGCGDDGGTTDPDPEFGTVAGTVQDPDGIAVPGVTVTLERSGASTLTETTDDTGAFSFDGVETGAWTATVAPPDGYSVATGEDASIEVNVAADQTANADFVIELDDPSSMVTIHMTSDNRFSPDEVEIAPGTTVRWVNDAAVTHTITPRDDGQDGVWERRQVSAEGEVFQHTFEVAGETYEYYCEPHESVGMTGTIVVTN